MSHPVIEIVAAVTVVACVAVAAMIVPAPRFKPEPPPVAPVVAMETPETDEKEPETKEEVAARVESLELQIQAAKQDLVDVKAALKAKAKEDAR